VAKDTNKMGKQDLTQKNEGKRTPQSRHDRETHVGSTNQVRPGPSVVTEPGIGVLNIS